MLKELKTAKWYWFIPLVSLYYSYTMSVWTMNGETYLSRLRRQTITSLNVVIPNMFIIVGLILTYII